MSLVFNYLVCWRLKDVCQNLQQWFFLLVSYFHSPFSASYLLKLYYSKGEVSWVLHIYSEWFLLLPSMFPLKVASSEVRIPCSLWNTPHRLWSIHWFLVSFFHVHRPLCSSQVLRSGSARQFATSSRCPPQSLAHAKHLINRWSRNGKHVTLFDILNGFFNLDFYFIWK